MSKYTPLFKAMKHYIDNNYINFHTPGHCQGKWVEQKLKETLGEELFQADLTELPGLDNLNFSMESIKESEKLAAQTFNSDCTKYLVNGASAGIIAAVLSTVDKKREKIIIPRNAHKSVYNGLILSGAEPVYIPLKGEGFFFNIDENNLESLIEKYKGTTILLTNPGYFGDCINLPAIRKKAGKERKIIVDEAHGAHLNFSDKLPPGASQSEADIWVQSIHKNLGSLTQSAMLHWKEKNVDSFKVLQMLELIQTSSPSYPLLLSLELAREKLENNKYLWDDFIKRIKSFREKLRELPGIRLFGDDPEEALFIYDLDITKITLFTDELDLTGFETAKILKEKYKILVELSGIDHILFYLTPAHDDKDLKYLYCALEEISKKYFSEKKYNLKAPKLPQIPKATFSPREALDMKYKILDVKEAIGKVSAGFVTPYPPGTPVLVPGEIINNEVVEFILEINSKNRFYLQGIERLNNKRICIRVIEESKRG